MVMCPVGFRAIRTTLERTVVHRFGHRLVDHDRIVAMEKEFTVELLRRFPWQSALQFPFGC